MKILLLQNVAKIGLKNEVKDVASGFAMNFLIPQGKATPATAENLKKIKNSEVVKNKGASEKIQKLNEILDRAEDEKITIIVKANEQGHLFAGIGEDDLSMLLKERGVHIEADNFSFEKPIKDLGEHTITVQVGDTTRSLSIFIVSF